jgi:outer membrane protein OmpA-like peptidoglycan-associated protein
MRILFFTLLVPAFSFAQNFTTIRTTSEKALVAYNDGIREASLGEAAIAQGYFEKALRVDPKFIDAKLALADTYTTLHDYFKAEQYFEEALALDTAYAPQAFLFLAESEWANDKYGECATHTARYLNSNPIHARRKKQAQYLLACSRFAAEAVLHPVPFNPTSLGTGVNTRESEYFPSLTADGSTLIFTRRERGDENFYSSTLNGTVWETATALEGVNTVQNEGAQAISPDGTWLVFTACNRSGDGSKGSCDLYWSQLKRSGWTEPVPFSATINSASWEAQPTIGADNKTLIYSRGSGGPNNAIALWQTTRLPNGKWATPEKLPPNINVGGKVHSPFLHPDNQTLYFSADSLPGMGGSDIFFVRRGADGAWGTPENIGYPINTKSEEGMMVVSLDGRTAYYASDRTGGSGGIDLYSFELPERARPRPVTYARVRVVDETTGYPLIAKVDFVDLKTGLSFTATNTKSDGTALVCLPAGKDYALHVSKDKYLFYSDHFNLTEVGTFQKPFLLNIELQPIVQDTSNGKILPGRKPIVLRNVFFETGSASLLPESAIELDRVVHLLTQMPTLHIQINGHTDKVGNTLSNQILSEERAKAVLDYLVGQAIDLARLQYKGYGESKPIETNDTAEGRAKNRRTEFEIW